MKPAFVTFAFLLLLLLLVAVAQAQAEQDNLMEVEEKEGNFMPQNKLRKNEKRLDAMDLRKKIIAEIYKRDSNVKRRKKKEKEKQPEKENFPSVFGFYTF